MPIFQPVRADHVEELLSAIQRYYAEDKIAFDDVLVRPAVERLVGDPTLGQSYFLLSETGERLGYVVSTFGYDHEAGGRLATVTDLFIEPDHRRRGHGRTALEFVVQTCRSLGVRVWNCRSRLTTLPGRRFTAALVSGRRVASRCSCRWVDSVNLNAPCPRTRMTISTTDSGATFAFCWNR